MSGVPPSGSPTQQTGTASGLASAGARAMSGSQVPSLTPFPSTAHLSAAPQMQPQVTLGPDLGRLGLVAGELNTNGLPGIGQGMGERKAAPKPSVISASGQLPPNPATAVPPGSAKKPTTDAKGAAAAPPSGSADLSDSLNKLQISRTPIFKNFFSSG